MDDKFKVVDENNLEHDAEVITAFTYKNKDYLVYSEDNDERQEVQNAVKEILSSIE